MSTVHYIVLIDNENETYDTSVLMISDSEDKINQKIKELKQKQNSYFVHITKTDDTYDGYIIDDVNSVSKIAEDVEPVASVASVVSAISDPTDVKKVEPTQEKIILLSTGAYAPVHKSHVQMIENAIKAVENEKPGAVVTALMSPSHKNYVGEKIKDKSLKVFAEGPIRIELCTKLISDMGLSDKIEVVDWESTQTNFVDYPEVVEEFKKVYDDATIMYIMGADNYKRIDEDLRDPGVPIVVVPRKNANDTDITFDLKQGDIQSAVTDNALLSSTQLREYILTKNWEKVQELTSENVMQMIKNYLAIN